VSRNPADVVGILAKHAVSVWTSRQEPKS
jgi:hypothetical protein